MAGSLHVSISAETIYEIGGFQVSNSIFTGVIVSILLIAFVFLYSGNIKNSKKISRLQALLELVIEGIYNLTKDIAGEKKAREFFPMIATAIIFILVNNWFGLLPGVGTVGVIKGEESHAAISVPAVSAANTSNPATTSADQEAAVADDHAVESVATTDQEVDHAADAAETEESHAAADDNGESDEHHGPTIVPIFRAATADLNTTLALALISVTFTQFYGFKYLGAGYLTKFFNFKQGPIFTFVGLLELVSEFAKIISFAFRLFGNIFAGEVLLAVIAFLIPALAPIPFIGLEIFVGFVQALVFAMLTLVFTNMATESHAEH